MLNLIFAVLLISQEACLFKPTIVERREQALAAENAQQIQESRRAGDPANPTLKIGRSAQEVRMTATVEFANASPEMRSFIRPAATAVLSQSPCKILASTPAGVQREDGAYNGYRVLAECGHLVIDVHEFDYRQRLTQRVVVNLPQAAVNVDFGPGKALARYYVSETGEYTTVLSWYDGSQEVMLYAVGPFDGTPIERNDDLRAMMTQMVALRRSSQ